MPFYTEDEFNEVKNQLNEIMDIIDKLSDECIYYNDLEVAHELRKILREKYNADL